MKPTNTFLALPLALFMAASAAASDPASSSRLPGWTPGAETFAVKTTQPRIDSISSIIYSQIKTQRAVRQLRMTMMIPRTDVKKPAVIYFPGGGFQTADWEKFTEMRTALAKAGFVVAAAEYRTIPDKFPALVEDAKSAVRYLRAHAAEYGIDPEKIGVLGDSAGGYVVQMLGTTNGEKQFDKGDNLNFSSDVQAVVTMFGISDLRSIGEGFSASIQKVHESPAVTEALLLHGVAFRNFAGAGIQSDPQKALAASPLGHVDGSEPPFLILHGALDPLVSPEQSRHLFEALKKDHVPATYWLVENAKHGDLPWFQNSIIDRVVQWFTQTLKPTPGNPQ